MMTKCAIVRCDPDRTESFKITDTENLGAGSRSQDERQLATLSHSVRNFKQGGNSRASPNENILTAVLDSQEGCAVGPTEPDLISEGNPRKIFSKRTYSLDDDSALVRRIHGKRLFAGTRNAQEVVASRQLTRRGIIGQTIECQLEEIL